MNAFVDRIAEKLMLRDGRLDQTTIIVPSERMINYLQKALFEVDGKPKISPRIITIDRWIQELAKKPVIHKTAALFELYTIFLADPVEHESRQFDAFLNWGQLLQSDFDEIDRYLVEPASLFRNLKDIKEIESWSFGNDELSEGQKRYMAFWDKLGNYYHAFDKRLNELGLYTKGKAYRYVANAVSGLIDHEQHYVFVGFNALSEAEIQIFNQLRVQGCGSFFFDNDLFYLKDELHEAGHFQRVLLERLHFKTPEETLNVLTTKAIEIDVVECAQYTNQATVIGSELLKLPPEEYSQTLILLADEDQLKSLLHHLPKSIGKANITLGLPLRNTAIKTWVDLIFQFQDGVQQYGSGSVYFRQLQAFVHHPFMEVALSKEEMTTLNRLEAECVRNNWQFVSKKNLEEKLKPREDFKGAPIAYELLQLLQTSWSDDWSKALAEMQELNDFLDARMDETAEYEQTIIRCFSSAVQVLQNLFGASTVPPMNRNTFRNLFQQHWSTESIAYYGNPLDGIQIMGMLETRGLDFKNVFVLGLNEGAMPPNNPIQTLIPMDLRQFFGMPTPREKQGLFAHHFYRLLHRAEKMIITYTSASEAFGSSEPSRFLKQIELELARVNKNIQLRFHQLASGNAERVGSTVIPKDEALLKRLEELIDGGLSFTKLTKYLNCPLNFYYQHVLQIGEENKIEEDLEVSTQGSILHYVMEKLFGDFVERTDAEGKHYPSQMVTIDDLKRMQDKIPLLVEEGFQMYFTDDPETWQRGINFIQYEMLKELILAALKREIEILEEHPENALNIVALEEELSSSLTVEINGVSKNIQLKGIVDRIDRMGDQLRIIDYKSGKVDRSDVNISTVKIGLEESILKKLKGNKKVHGLQLMMYAFLIQRNLPLKVDAAGIVSFINHKSSPVFLEQDLSLASVEPILTAVIQEIINELFDAGQPFRHNSASKYCPYCS